jgi:hypothetical protein
MTIASLDPLTDLTAAVKTCLISNPWFAGIPILTYQRGDIINEIEQALGKLGLVIVIEHLPWTPEFDSEETFDITLTLGITVTEMPLLNQAETGTRKSGDATVVKIVEILNPFRGAPAIAEKCELVNDTDGQVSHLITAKADARYALAAQ